jgi:hypothetical protein
LEDDDRAAHHAYRDSLTGTPDLWDSAHLAGCVRLGVRRSRTLALAATLLVFGILLGLVGLFFIAYGGDSGGGDSYMTVADDKIDADVVGALVLLGAVLVGGVATVLFRRSRR